MAKIETIKYLVVLFLLLISLVSKAQSYQKIHLETIVVDTHNDVLGAAVMRGMQLEDNLTMKAHSDFKRFKAGGVDVQVFSIFCNSTYGKSTAYKFANREIDSLLILAKRNLIN